MPKDEWLYTRIGGKHYFNEEDSERVNALRNRLHGLIDEYYGVLHEHGYVYKGFQRAPIDEEVYFSHYYRDNGDEFVALAYSNTSAIGINCNVFERLRNGTTTDYAHLIDLIYHEITHLEENSGDHIGVSIKRTEERKYPIEDTHIGDVFNEGLTNLKSRRLMDKKYGKGVIPKVEQIDCGYMTNIGGLGYNLATQLVDNLLTALGLDIDELIKDGINNKQNHRANIIEHFSRADVSFIADIAPPMEQMYQYIYESRKRDLTQIEKQKIGKLIDKIQTTTKSIYIKTRPDTTKEETQAFTQNFIDTSKTYTQTKFLCELCGIKPIDKTNAKDYCLST